jgi:hypothetical protein
MADKAVLCGINDYESISDLRGCINDVENVEQLLLDSFGFESANIRTYVDDKVTKNTVIDSFEWLADGTKEGDRLLFHFSGHGSYTSSDDGDEEVDELICLYDMDWSDPDSYIVDDDLGDLTRSVKSGRLSVILDCCHSGSGTRAVTARFALARSASPKSRLIILADTAAHMPTGRSEDNMRRLTSGNTALLRSFREERARPTFARFVEPPAKYRISPTARKVKGLGTKLRVELNHQLLAGARDDQTAADAFIAGEYNGAFSYYLCDTVRTMGIKSYDEIMDTTIAAIRSEGYSQVPQNEGPFGNEALFGSNAVSPTSPDSPLPSSSIAVMDASGFAKDSSKSAIEPQPLQVLADFLRVTEKLVDLSAATPKTDASVGDSDRSSGDEVVVYVHGISQHRTGYSAPWFSSMRPYLERSLERSEVLWSMLVNPRSRRASDNRKVQEFVDQIEQELVRRTEALERQVSLESRNARLERPRGSGLSIDDFARYMLVESTREAILAKFDETVRPMLSAGRTVHIVAHSWGTTVSYEGLRRMDSDQFAGRVANLFLVGSALSIAPVRSNLFGRVSDGRKPRAVNRIINIDAGGDIVGGPIGDHFTVHQESIGLEPVGCTTVPFTSIALNPLCAHSSYFNSENMEVNRNIFASNINRST